MSPTTTRKRSPSAVTVASGAFRDRILEFRKVPAQDLLPNPKNWRTHSKRQAEALSGILAEVGIAGAAIARKLPDGKLMLIDGHLRREAMEVVPTLILDVDEAEADKLLATFDPLSAMAGKDSKALASLLAEIATESDGLRALLATLGKSGRVGAEDSIAELPKQPKTKAGDLWLLGKHRLLCGDAEQRPMIVKLFGREDAPKLMVTDPPYGVNYDPEWRDGVGLAPGTSLGKVKNDGRADWTEVWKLFPGEVAYVWHSGVHSARVQESLLRADFVVRSQIIWVKQMLQLSRGDYHWRHEPCFYAVRKGSKSGWTGDRKQTTVWEVQSALGFARDQGPENERTGHSTQKPVELFRRAILNNSSSGDPVFDPFVGSGTAIIACETTKRRCFAIELDPRYVRAAITRWEKFTGQKATLAR